MPRRSAARERVGGVADLALAGQEHEHVRRDGSRRSSSTASHDRLRPGRGRRPPRASRTGGSGPRPGTSGRTPRRSAPACRPVPRSARRTAAVSMVAEVMTTLRSGRRGRSCVQVAEQEVDVQAALVGLVDDQGVVAAEQPVALDLGEQDAVGHHLDQRPAARPVGEPHLVADRVPEPGAELLGDPLGDGARGDPPRLRVPDLPGDATAELQADLRQLGGLARPVSPATTTTWWSRMAAAISSRRSLTGSSG